MNVCTRRCRTGRKDKNAIGKEDGFDEVVRNKDGRLPGLSTNLLQFEVHLLAGHSIQRTERLVHEQQHRIVNERPRNGHTLLHSSGELPDMTFAEFGEIDELQKLPDPPFPIPYIETQNFNRQKHVVEDRPPGQ